jgi:hypothetical protein
MQTRRRVLAAGLGVVTLAGCTQSGVPDTEGATTTGGDDSETDTESPATGTTETSETGERDGTGETDGAGDSADLDLREANVVGVVVEAQGNGQYRFDVTLIHDDAGEEGYANWWQVETTGGERLGRRELLHAHGTRAFTRSETIAVPEGVTRVVVRGHDQTHGYGGQAMVVDLTSGETRVVRQGAERERIE